MLYTIVFPDWYDDRAEFEHEAKGFLGEVEVRFPEGARYQLFFYDSGRLGQDLEEEARLGNPYLSEPGLVVIPTVSREAIHKAVAGLWRKGFFNHLRPLS